MIKHFKTFWDITEQDAFKFELSDDLMVIDEVVRSSGPHNLYDMWAHLQKLGLIVKTERDYFCPMGTIYYHSHIHDDVKRPIKRNQIQNISHKPKPLKKIEEDYWDDDPI